MVKETFSVLSDVSWTFKNIKFDDKFSAQLEKFSDDLDDFKIDFTEINEALTNMNTDQTYDEDLENELNELLEEDPVNTSNPRQQIMQPIARPIAQPQDVLAQPIVASQEQEETPQTPVKPNKQLIVEL